MTDLSKIFAENQKEMVKLIAPITETQNSPLNVEDTDSETENALPTTTSTPVKTKRTIRKVP